MTGPGIGIILVLAALLSICAGLAVAFAALWVHERQMREQEQGWRTLNAASDRLDGAYVRRELTRLYDMGRAQ